MKSHLRLLLSVSVLFFSGVIYSQDIERVILDAKDPQNGYYLAVRPQSKQVKGVLVLLSSFLPPEALLPETKLHNIASVSYTHLTLPTIYSV